MSVNLRIHIAPVGFDFRRVTEPLIRMRADRVYFIRYSDNDAVQKFYTQIKKELGSKYPLIKIEEVYVDMWNLIDCLEKFREIIQKEKGHHIYINVSTGTKITAIAGMLACMLWGANPYYAPISYPKLKEVDIPATEFIDDADILPVYEIMKPKPEHMKILNLLKAHGGKMKKSQLIAKLESEGIIKIRDESKKPKSETWKHSQLRVITDPMENEWGFVKIKSSGQRSDVLITEKGEIALKIFGLENN